ncbi:MAG: prepilin-type N-terminal cleavage/methylation domain-containing protein [Herminiimonas sp.]|uniref:prepilin-type N-terminal cleavage/methylation domain-containing protein n=1 Tax=Herminiimonas sp. TaxID=1926289 RepID=UPI0027237095|nr:prepilin-type N-terminal cleavage/methylation domain-containing protein [Herminiimonas sp.]MDO9421463.1 prepilin-type N-terminal cleavage/methylation domain-containing protein [Herminiimonas sp.]
MPDFHKFSVRNPLAPACQKGFTLVEIAVVLVIIGLLLGGILQGQSLIRAMRVKDIVATAKDLSIASQQFKDRYRYLPGDWKYTANEIPNVTVGGDGSGIINTTTESNNVPVHLFNASFIRSAQLQSVYGTVRVLGNTAAAGSVVASGSNPIPAAILNVIEFANLPCDVAVEVDLKLDDGDITKGTSRASITSAACAIENTVVPGFATPL